MLFRRSGADGYADLRLPLSERLPIVAYSNLFLPQPTTVWISPQVERLTGYRVDEWVGTPGFVELILHPDDRIPVMQEVEASRRELRPFSRDYRILNRAGEIMWIHDESVPICDGNDRPELIQGYFVDITARKELEQQLLHAQKVDALGRLASEVAHDFNNHLVAIAAHVSLLEGELPDASPARNHARAIGETAERAAVLTRRLLSYGRREAARPRPIHVDEVIAELEPMLAHITGTTVELLPLLRPTPPVHADPSQLEQVVANLVVNARDAMPGGGTVSIRTYELRVQPGLMAERFDVPPGDYVTLVVADDGPGIDRETQARIFEPYFTTKKHGEGTGLGLSIVDKIVRQAGGGLHLQSAPGAGSRFRILLPVMPANGR